MLVDKQQLKDFDGRIFDVFDLVHKQWKKFDVEIDKYKEHIETQISYEIDAMLDLKLIKYEKVSN
jgi:hypothetical protein